MPTPAEVLNRLSGVPDGASTALCRDEWVEAKGTEIPDLVRRHYVVHAREPRFVCRVLESPRDPIATEAGIHDYEEPMDILGGLAYCEGDDYTLIEFQWLDPIPNERRVQDLIRGALMAHDPYWEERFKTENIPVGMLRALEWEGRLSREEAIAQMAKLFEVETLQVKEWITAVKPLTAEVLNRLVKPLSGAEIPDGAICRDEWLSAMGAELGNGRERWYLVHAWKPRFICRIVQVDPATGVAADWERPVAGIQGLTYGVDEETEFCEFHWLDPIPAGPELRELLSQGADSLEKTSERDALEILDAEEYGDDKEE